MLRGWLTLFPLRWRVFLWARWPIYYTAPSVGLILGSIIAGVLAQAYGWRVALLAIGAPGLLLAGATILFLKDPSRLILADEKRTEAPATIWQVLRHIIVTPELRTLVIALILGGVPITSIAAWTPIMLQRVHGVSQAMSGSLTALVLGVAGGAGTVFGGIIASRYAGGEPGKLRTLCAMVLLLASPVVMLAPLLTWLPALLMLLALWSLIAAAYIAPAWNLCVSMCPSHMRATILATSLVFANLVGSGIGPWYVGRTSDILLSAGDGAHLQHAMASLSIFALLTALLFFSHRAKPSR